MSRSIKIVFGILVAGGLVALGIWAFKMGRQDMAGEVAADQPLIVPPKVSADATGASIIILDAPTQERIGLKTEVPAATNLQPTVTAFGSLQEDPSQSFILRAPFNGTLHAPASGNFPNMGDQLTASQTIGAIEPRLLPTDKLDLQSKLVAAKSDVDANEATYSAASEDYERIKKLNAMDKSASDRALQEAQARATSEESHFKASQQTYQMLEAALAAETGPSSPVPLIIPRAGQIVELTARPGESLESGQPILRVVSYEKLLAVVTIPLGDPIDPNAAHAEIQVAGMEDHPQTADRVAAVSADPLTLGQSLMFRVSAAKSSLRPGMAVTALIPAPGGAKQGVIIPRAAVVRLNGRAWAYVQTAPDKFLRREVPLDQPTPTGWFASSIWAAADHIVIVGSQVLVSEEFKSQIQITD
jgi:biotin carboxyl carrier protein